MFFFKYTKTKCIDGCELFNDEKNYSYWENKKEIHVDVKKFELIIIKSPTHSAGKWNPSLSTIPSLNIPSSKDL